MSQHQQHQEKEHVDDDDDNNNIMIIDDKLPRKNALTVLMEASLSQQHGKKRRLSSLGSRFVLCPAGCGKHFLESKINLHLDKCIQEQEVLEKKKLEDNKSGIILGTADNVSVKRDGDAYKESAMCLRSAGASLTVPEEQEQDTTNGELSSGVAVSAAGSSIEITPRAIADQPDKQEGQPVVHDCGSSKGPNAFSRMMQRSKVVFAADKPPLQQCVHLSAADGAVSFYQGRNRPNEHVTWSSQLRMRDCGHLSAAPAPPNTSLLKEGEAVRFPQRRRPIELTICTSHHPSLQPTGRLVRQHSRLSVPVLKSILQKSIRRRKPLPAVRVAMELADKSLSDLLRRLPVIVMEDSTLHPGLPFLVWLMIADSKGFLVTNQLLTCVMRIVYEIASCQFSDPLAEIDEGLDNSTPGLSLNTLCSEPSVPTGFTANDDGVTILWAILARAEYGGMRGDIRMLHRYACLWEKRFKEAVPAAVASRIMMRSMNTDDPTNASGVIDQGETSLLPWLKVPAHIHVRARAQSEERVTSLCAEGLERLSMEDICVEGVDFHCSSIVDHLLSLQVAGVCTDLLLLSGQEVMPTTAEGRRSYLEGIYKHCMWHFSSGINRRQPLEADEKKSAKDTQPAYEGLWKDLIAKEALKFQTNYVHQCLARP